MERETNQQTEINEFNSALFSLFKSSGAYQTNRDWIASPLSIYAASLLLLEGLEGESKEEWTEALQLNPEGSLLPTAVLAKLKDLLTNESNHLKILNSVWVNESLQVKKAYQKKVETEYEAAIKPIAMNRRSVQEINEWVSEGTSGLIDSVIESLDAKDLLVIINAIYFKDKWSKQFKPENTKQLTFFQSNQVKIPLFFMKQQSKYRYLKAGGFSLIALKTARSKASFVACMPDDNNQFDPITDFEVEYLDQLLSTKKQTLVELELPKFKFDQTLNLVEILKGLGVKKVFNSRDCDDFEGIFQDQKEGYVSSFIHKVCIDANEVGVEAAAVSVIRVKKSKRARTPNEKVSLRFNRPFLFFIVEEDSKLILFSGVYRGHKQAGDGGDN